MGKRKELPPEISFLTADDKDKFITEKITLKHSFHYRKVDLEAGTEFDAVKYVKIDSNKNFDLKKHLSCPEWFTLCKMFKIPNASRMRIEHMRVCIAKAVLVKDGNSDQNYKNDDNDGKTTNTDENSSNKQAGRRQLPLHQQEEGDASAQDTNATKDDINSGRCEDASSSNENGATAADGDKNKGKRKESPLRESSASTTTRTKDVHHSEPKSNGTTESTASVSLSHAGNKSKEAVALAISKASSLSTAASCKLAESTLAILTVGVTKPPADIIARLAEAETDLVNATAAVAAARARAIAASHLMAMENNDNKNETTDDNDNGRPNKKARHSTG